MNKELRKIADEIVGASLKAVLPDEAVQRALADYKPGSGRTLLVATGKAAWQMAKAAHRAKCDIDGTYVAENFVPDPSGQCSVKDQYKKFREYLSDYGLAMRSRPTFVEAVRRIFPQVVVDYSPWARKEQLFVGIKEK